ncbi:MAG: hypothetical protein H6740_19540 [Alphaproteobacteria bacterium]|nr:hypothetical protein [Alphaproteobacteria bacterium]
MSRFTMLSLFLLTGAWSSCASDLLDDPGFDVWCGDQLCEWEVEQGAVERVPTWHPEDEGALLVGDPVVLSQRANITQADATCIRFELVADVQADASLTLSLDFMDDGSAEYEHPLVSDNFEQVHYYITAPHWYDGVRFRIRKDGEGDAVLATIRATAVSLASCSGDPIAVDNVPLGADCLSGEGCASGFCADVPLIDSSGWLPASFLTCGRCESSEDCREGELCGVVFAGAYSAYRACMRPPERLLGQACAVDEECSSGTCCEGQCSECCQDRGCAEGDCERREPFDSHTPEGAMPFVCEATLGERQPGEPCMEGSDCASGLCPSSGVVSICDPAGESCRVSQDCDSGDCVAVSLLNGACG